MFLFGRGCGDTAAGLACAGPVGASLLAMAVQRSIEILEVRPSSRASSLPQGYLPLNTERMPARQRHTQPWARVGNVPFSPAISP
ncbi:hypothetical protein FHK92_24505 [Pseudomonas brassicacearum subsp. neoaurantiaca]|uniref:Uncharacterized protein n=1 Tax=Pseudomonas brassicacearum subsp. neoaurantiaca TaxID=494916 RepID=A0A7V8UG26_9PSED|nr:hypothetical protein [Pseudomonas brassicacearum subsp. neoaurantiaca]